jgi:hypothetical protein
MSPVLTGRIARKRKRISSKPRRPTNCMRLEMLLALPPPSQVSPGHSESKPLQALANEYTDDGRINISLTSKSPAKLAELLHVSRTPVSAVHEPVPNNGSWRCPRLNIVIHVVGSRGTSLQQPQRLGSDTSVLTVLQQVMCSHSSHTVQAYKEPATVFAWRHTTHLPILCGNLALSSIP